MWITYKHISQKYNSMQNNHLINWQDAIVLGKECDTRSHHIRTMNRDKGAHFLLHVYDPLLKSSTSVRKPPSGDHQREKLDQASHF